MARERRADRRRELRRRPRPPAPRRPRGLGDIPDEGLRAYEPRLVPCDDLGEPGDVDYPRRSAGEVQERRRRTDVGRQWSSSAPSPRALEVVPTRSALTSARLQPRLTVEQAAKRAGLTPDQVEWLEEGRVYRFPSTDHAIEATLLLAAALEIGQREARELAGLPVPPRPLDVNPVARLIGVAALSAALMAFVAFVLVPAVAGKPAPPRRPGRRAGRALPKPWQIQVEVLNGAGDINWTRQVGSRIQSLAYTVKKVGRADRFDYPQSAVYYSPGRPPDRDPARPPARLRHAPAPGRDEPEPPRRDRRPAPRARLAA